MSDLSNNVDKIDTNLSNLINQTESTNKNTQAQISGTIKTNYGHGVPTKENAPAVEWVKRHTEGHHVNEIYYDIDTGKCYRWIEAANSTESKREYMWYEIIDASIINALASAALAQNIADSKCQVFSSVPAPPYNVGDLWFWAVMAIYISVLLHRERLALILIVIGRKPQNTQTIQLQIP